MSKEQYVIKLNPGVMKAFLLNLCAHDVIHDFNKDSTKRLVSLKEKIRSVFRLDNNDNNKKRRNTTMTRILNNKKKDGIT